MSDRGKKTARKLKVNAQIVATLSSEPLKKVVGGQQGNCAADTRQASGCIVPPSS